MSMHARQKCLPHLQKVIRPLCRCHNSDRGQHARVRDALGSPMKQNLCDQVTCHTAPLCMFIPTGAAPACMLTYLLAGMHPASLGAHVS